MGSDLKKLERRKKARAKLDELHDKSAVLLIHYSCESLYDRLEGKTPRITSIGYEKHEVLGRWFGGFFG
jgi:hypothetical protein